MNKKHKIFFQNLDGLRFLSFLLVFLSHSFVTTNPYILKSEWYRIVKGRIFSDGDIGVSFFFVLSGFLITYLLLKEKEYTFKIDIKSFYIRRALRIWPLYYFCVCFGFLIFPILKSYFGQIPNETANPLLCSLFLNNFNRIINGPPDSSVLSVLWSVAIEEQFYLIWPILFFFVPEKKYIFIFIVVIFISLAYRFINYNTGNIELNSLGVISDMAIGGLGAFLSLKSKWLLPFISNLNNKIHLVPYFFVILVIVFKYEIFDNFFLVVLKRLITSLVFIWIILEQNFCDKSLFKISNLKSISYLGKYTYGLYCLHPIAILISITVLRIIGLDTLGWQLWLFQIPLSLSVSIILSLISYNFFERKFLKLKEKYSYITK